MKKYLLLLILLLIPLIPTSTHPGSFVSVNHPAWAVGVTTPDIICGVSGLAAAGGPTALSQYKFESGAHLTDTQGNNDLVVTTGDPGDAATYKEGSGAVDFDGSDAYSIADASLSADFPGETGHLDFTICGWCNADNSAADGYMVGRYDADNDNRMWVISFESDNFIKFIVGYSSGESANSHVHTTEMTDDIWYGYCVSYNENGSGSSEVVIRMYDANGDHIDNDYTSSIAESMSANETVDFVISARAGSAGPENFFDGLMDNVLIYDSVLTTTQMDALF